MRVFTRLLVAASLAGSCFAQHSWLPLGEQVSDGRNDQELVEVDLGFPFTMPGGTTSPNVVVCRYGRILETNPVGNWSTPGNPTLTAGTAAQPTFLGSIQVGADWFSYESPTGLAWFYTDGATVAAVTWTGMSTNQTVGTPCTFQVQLHADGRIVTMWDSQCSALTTAMAGVSPGGGVALPADRDLLADTSAGPLVTSDPMVYSYFGFNLAGWALEFVPDGAGGALGWTVNGSSSGADPVYATNRPRSAGCFVPTSYLFVPDGVGGYDVTSGPSQYTSNVGVSAGVTSDDGLTAVGIDLGFAMPFPDGSVHQFVDIDPNGRILPTGAAGPAGTFVAPLVDPSQLLSSGYPAFFGMWSDWDVEQLNADGVYFRTDPGSATFTWRNVPQSRFWYSSGSGENPPCTWQIRLLQSGTVIVTHQDLAGMNLPDVPVLDAAVGMTSGVAPDPGQTDFSMLSSVALNVPGFAYEYWDCSYSQSSGLPPTEPVDLLIATPTIAGLTRPAIGGNWELQVQGVAGSTFGFYAIGLNSANNSLQPFGSPCVRATTFDLTQFRLADGLGNLQSWGITIPSNPALAGYQLFAQGAVDEPIGGDFAGFLGMPFALKWSNAVRGTIGQL